MTSNLYEKLLEGALKGTLTDEDTDRNELSPMESYRLYTLNYKNRSERAFREKYIGKKVTLNVKGVPDELSNGFSKNSILPGTSYEVVNAAANYQPFYNDPLPWDYKFVSDQFANPLAFFLSVDAPDTFLRIKVSDQPRWVSTYFFNLEEIR